MNLKKGIVKLIPESLDDLWHLYNIIYPNDEVYMQTTREIKQNVEYTRPQKPKRVSVFLGVKVQKVGWDRTLNRLRVHGTICHAPEDLIGLGSHHTLKILVNKPLTIVKSKWQKHQLERLEKACKKAKPAIILISVDDEGFCIATLRQFGLEVKVEEKVGLPSKRQAEKREEALKALFKKVLKALNDIWMPLKNQIVVLGVGFIKNSLVEYLKDKAPEIAKSIIDVKSVNNSGLAGIHEALRSGILTKALEHVRVVEESKIVEEVLERLGRNEPVTYGIEEVKRASQYGAIEKLVVTDVKLRESPDEERLELENLMKEVEDKGGKVVIVSAEHEAGRKLMALGGLAAILRFPIG
jgi:protein pelota